MRTRLHGGDDVTELDALLERVGKLGYTLHAFRVDRHGPEYLAAVRDYGGIADVLILVDEDHACAWRTPTGHAFDVFNPQHVWWFYAHSPVWTLRALLTLAPPGHPDAPTVITDMPPGYGIPAQGRTPVRVRKRERG